ncbi:hypothetical protein AAY473_031994 [Plecturocebus cupreus]
MQFTGVTQAREQTGSAAQAHGNLSSSTFRKPGLTSGPAGIWNEESNLCCALQCSMAYTSDSGALLLLWRLPLTREPGTDRGSSSSNHLQLMLQAELAGFATENTKLPLYLLITVGSWTPLSLRPAAASSSAHLPTVGQRCHRLTGISRVAGITGVHQYAQQIFIILVETGFCQVGQGGLKLLNSSDSPASLSQSTEIIGMSCHTQPKLSLQHINALCLRRQAWLKEQEHRRGPREKSKSQADPSTTAAGSLRSLEGRSPASKLGPGSGVEELGDCAGRPSLALDAAGRLSTLHQSLHGPRISVALLGSAREGPEALSQRLQSQRRSPQSSLAEPRDSELMLQVGLQPVDNLRRTDQHPRIKDGWKRAEVFDNLLQLFYGPPSSFCEQFLSHQCTLVPAVC